MPFLPKAGATALIYDAAHPKPHLFIFLTNPFNNPPEIICVNITTKTNLSDTRLVFAARFS